jgi:hypothetical protein
LRLAVVQLPSPLTPTTAMTHIAIQEALDGRNVVWMEHVTNEQYLAGPSRE